ncbi:hypothetical protein [Microbulbifer agarilyticus]|uniref:hypothetical protein n=1 Tax=Microbulbifer agarilyticus TaxID=260552 RepID=UPI001CD602B1|nr:hypothetical protein [Microbulbifer agarilyticus]MCA0900722.1 hypothetical protein [Microbulbifer agarilyticus]
MTVAALFILLLMPCTVYQVGFNQLTTLELGSQTGGSLDSAIAPEADPNQITIDHTPIFITMKKTCKGFLLQNLIQKQIQPAAE